VTARSATRLRSDSRRLHALDGLRALAVIMVFFNHLDDHLFTGGYLGVTLFFALSGYLITSLLLDEHRRTGTIRLRAFYTRRVLRLMPALFTMVLLTLGASVFVGQGQTLRDAWPALVYLQDIVAPVTHTLGGIYNHTWSLGVEEQFYLLWPALLLWGLRRRISITLAAVIVILAGLGADLLAEAYLHSESSGDIYRSPYTYFPVMAVGIILAVGLQERARWTQIPLVRRSALPAACLLGFLVSTRVLPSSVWMFRGGFIAAGAAAILVIAHVAVVRHGWMTKLLTVRPLLWLGERSYGFYLWHAPVILLLRKELGGGLIRVAVLSALVSLLLTEASWRFVEKPFLRLKDRSRVAGTGHLELPSTPPATSGAPSAPSGPGAPAKAQLDVQVSE
jgi:peptidoglycan/LPS O-acetylase OafA/YrhL